LASTALLETPQKRAEAAARKKADKKKLCAHRTPHTRLRLAFLIPPPLSHSPNHLGEEKPGWVPVFSSGSVLLPCPAPIFLPSGQTREDLSRKTGHFDVEVGKMLFSLSHQQRLNQKIWHFRRSVQEAVPA
jgi:hypothetical protein